MVERISHADDEVEKGLDLRGKDIRPILMGTKTSLAREGVYMAPTRQAASSSNAGMFSWKV